MPPAQQCARRNGSGCPRISPDGGCRTVHIRRLWGGSVSLLSPSCRSLPCRFLPREGPLPVTVDVLLPFYGDVAMMKQAVESILGQHSTEWKLTVIYNAAYGHTTRQI